MSTNLYLSKTSISTYLNCQRRFKYKYIDKINPKQKITNKYMAFGNSMHLTLADFNKLTENKYRTIDNLHNLLRKNWIRDGYDSRDEEREFGLWGLEMLTNYFKNPQDKGSDNLIIEEMIYLNKEDYTLCGKLDKVYKNENGTTEILDYKTSKSISSIDNLQLPLYLMLAKSKLGYYPSVVSLYYLAENKKISKEVNESFIAKCTNDVLSLCDEIISKSEYECRPDAYCESKCENFNVCDPLKNENLIILNKIKNFENETYNENIF
ncbi:RecB family exonuclease [Sporosalibacterium faouarense]|uniref:RecB family exonuclease n=1 Tax=Sporosalibacterium faouarense TaxID=516123 RepID=UPI00192B8596|nr:PD-(D/E)XK nuclease family protein [Sporosalibacterium faouarense]